MKSGGDKIDGGTISNFTSTGIDDNADALAITIDADEDVGIGVTTPDDKLEVAGNIEATGVFKAANGTNAAPSYSFTNDTDMGFYRSFDNIMSFSISGSEILRFQNNIKVVEPEVFPPIIPYRPFLLVSE